MLELGTAWRMRTCILALLMVNSHSSDVGMDSLTVPGSANKVAMTMISEVFVPALRQCFCCEASEMCGEDCGRNNVVAGGIYARGVCENCPTVQCSKHSVVSVWRISRGT